MNLLLCHGEAGPVERYNTTIELALEMGRYWSVTLLNGLHLDLREPNNRFSATLAMEGVIVGR